MLVLIKKKDERKERGWGMGEIRKEQLLAAWLAIVVEMMMVVVVVAKVWHRRREEGNAIK